MQTKILIPCALIAATFPWGPPALAHHSYAMFDRNQTRTLVGTVKEFQAVNPHSYLILLVQTKSGHVQEWSIETNGILQLQRNGIQQTSFNPGDKVTVTIHPLRSGLTGGDFLSATLANGKIVSVSHA